jgi:cell division protein FtsB
MVVRRRIRAFLIPLVLYAVSGGIVAYFLHNAKMGNRGLLAKQELKMQSRELARELDAARAEHAAWDRRIALLRSDQIDRDILDERARIMLGRVHRNDLVIITPNATGSN